MNPGLPGFLRVLIGQTLGGGIENLPALASTPGYIFSMLIGKWWLRPGKAAIEVSATEHALVARRVMLGLEPDAARFTQRDMLSALTEAEIAEFRKIGVEQQALEFLCVPNDPRIFAIREWCWIRVRRDRFYLWKLDAASLRVIRESHSFWSAQPKSDPRDAADIVELSSGDEFSLSIRRLLDGRSKPASLRTAAMRSLCHRRQR